MGVVNNFLNEAKKRYDNSFLKSLLDKQADRKDKKEEEKVEPNKMLAESIRKDWETKISGCSRKNLADLLTEIESTAEGFQTDVEKRAKCYESNLKLSRDAACKKFFEIVNKNPLIDMPERKIMTASLNDDVKKKSNLSPGDKVKHPKFKGEGVVAVVSPEGNATVQFGEEGTATFDKDIASKELTKSSSVEKQSDHDTVINIDHVNVTDGGDLNVKTREFPEGLKNVKIEPAEKIEDDFARTKLPLTYEHLPAKEPEIPFPGTITPQQPRDPQTKDTGYDSIWGAPATERTSLSSLNINSYIRHRDGRWVVFSESGKVLGKHSTKEEAEKQLQAIHISQHRASLPLGAKDNAPAHQVVDRKKVPAAAYPVFKTDLMHVYEDLKALPTREEAAGSKVSYNDWAKLRDRIDKFHRDATQIKDKTARTEALNESRVAIDQFKLIAGGYVWKYERSVPLDFLVYRDDPWMFFSLPPAQRGAKIVSKKYDVNNGTEDWKEGGFLVKRSGGETLYWDKNDIDMDKKVIDATFFEADPVEVLRQTGATDPELEFISRQSGRPAGQLREMIKNNRATLKDRVEAFKILKEYLPKYEHGKYADFKFESKKQIPFSEIEEIYPPKDSPNLEEVSDREAKDAKTSNQKILDKVSGFTPEEIKLLNTPWTELTYEQADRAYQLQQLVYRAEEIKRAGDMPPVFISDMDDKQIAELRKQEGERRARLEEMWRKIEEGGRVGPSGEVEFKKEQKEVTKKDTGESLAVGVVRDPDSFLARYEEFDPQEELYWALSELWESKSLGGPSLIAARSLTDSIGSGKNWSESQMNQAVNIIKEYAEKLKSEPSPEPAPEATHAEKFSGSALADPGRLRELFKSKKGPLKRLIIDRIIDAIDYLMSHQIILAEDASAATDLRGQLNGLYGTGLNITEDQLERGIALLEKYKEQYMEASLLLLPLSVMGAGKKHHKVIPPGYEYIENFRKSYPALRLGVADAINSDDPDMRQTIVDILGAPSLRDAIRWFEDFEKLLNTYSEEYTEEDLGDLSEDQKKKVNELQRDIRQFKTLVKKLSSEGKLLVNKEAPYYLSWKDSHPEDPAASGKDREAIEKILKGTGYGLDAGSVEYDPGLKAFKFSYRPTGTDVSQAKKFLESIRGRVAKKLWPEVPMGTSAQRVNVDQLPPEPGVDLPSEKFPSIENMMSEFEFPEGEDLFKLMKTVTPGYKKYRGMPSEDIAEAQAEEGEGVAPEREQLPESRAQEVVEASPEAEAKVEEGEVIPLPGSGVLERHPADPGATIRQLINIGIRDRMPAQKERFFSREQEKDYAEQARQWLVKHFGKSWNEIKGEYEKKVGESLALNVTSNPQEFLGSYDLFDQSQEMFWAISELYEASMKLIENGKEPLLDKSDLTAIRELMDYIGSGEGREFNDAQISEAAKIIARYKDKLLGRKDRRPGQAPAAPEVPSGKMITRKQKRKLEETKEGDEISEMEKEKGSMPFKTIYRELKRGFDPSVAGTIRQDIFEKARIGSHGYPEFVQKIIGEGKDLASLEAELASHKEKSPQWRNLLDKWNKNLGRFMDDPYTASEKTASLPLSMKSLYRTISGLPLSAADSGKEFAVFDRVSIKDEPKATGTIIKLDETKVPDVDIDVLLDAPDHGKSMLQVHPYEIMYVGAANESQVESAKQAQSALMEEEKKYKAKMKDEVKQEMKSIKDEEKSDRREEKEMGKAAGLGNWGGIFTWEDPETNRKYKLKALIEYRENLRGDLEALKKELVEMNDGSGWRSVLHLPKELVERATKFVESLSPQDVFSVQSSLIGPAGPYPAGAPIEILQSTPEEFLFSIKGSVGFGWTLKSNVMIKADDPNTPPADMKAAPGNKLVWDKVKMMWVEKPQEDISTASLKLPLSIKAMEAEEKEIDPKELEKGMRKELEEHAETIKEVLDEAKKGNPITPEDVARSIADDHLRKNPKAYEKEEAEEGGAGEEKSDGHGVKTSPQVESLWPSQSRVTPAGRPRPRYFAQPNTDEREHG